jgi:hypothetical protein
MVCAGVGAPPQERLPVKEAARLVPLKAPRPAIRASSDEHRQRPQWRRHIPLRKRLQMPRGSKPGTKRGGRKQGTPNRRTILADRILVAAAAHPVATWQELLSVLMDDQALPADTRLVIAQKSRLAAARSNTPSGDTQKSRTSSSLEVRMV